ncbi:recombinase family protein [Sphingomonas panacis]|uniref:recombinase family protein n=1 Tax=Sphingomonas panacis TaxID=1560345 RepID=UPI0009F3EE6E|nr:recombinase family protein [Sphingomonas panacis]
MTRVALYARYSSDQQSASSIDDQLRICRDQAARDNWRVVGTYKDAAISGSSITLRPGIQQLLQDAQAGRFDVILAEALDRVSRDQADVATLYKHLQFIGVALVTLAEGEISELHVGLKGTMNALFLKDLAKKTHRGMRGRIEKGKAGGGLCYGYDVMKRLDGDGEPIRGERSINEPQAEIVRRVFREFGNGVSPQMIARRLNAEGIPGPEGQLWTDGTLRGHVKRGTGFLNNELYVGRLVWNRQRYVKDPRTGKRVSRINPVEEWIITEVPELRILDDALWDAAKTRQASIAIQYAGPIEATRKAISLRNTVRPKSLLSGLLHCGVCGGPYTLRGQGRFACSTHNDTRACGNGHTITRVSVEERVVAGLKDRLMAPDMVGEAIRGYVDETNRLNYERRAAQGAAVAALAKIDRAKADIVAAIEDGRFSKTLMDRLLDLEANEEVLRATMAEVPADTPDIHPNIANIYAKKVERLADALNRPQDRDEAAEAIRSLIKRVTLTPGAKRGEINITLHGEFGAILQWLGAGGSRKNDDSPTAGAAGLGVSSKLVAGTGFEPVTFRL